MHNGQKSMCVSNETTFITRPWVLHCFCFYQIDMRELLQCQVWKSRWKEINIFPAFHLDPQNLVFHSKEANTVVRMQAWQQFAHHWTVAKQPKNPFHYLTQLEVQLWTWSLHGKLLHCSSLTTILFIHLSSECQQAKTVLSKKQTSQLRRKSTCPKFHKNLISNCPSPWLLTDMPILTTLDDPNTRFLQMLLLFSIHSGQKLTENLWKTWDFFLSLYQCL